MKKTIEQLEIATFVIRSLFGVSKQFNNYHIIRLILSKYIGSTSLSDMLWRQVAKKKSIRDIPSLPISSIETFGVWLVHNSSQMLGSSTATLDAEGNPGMVYKYVSHMVNILLHTILEPSGFFSIDNLSQMGQEMYNFTCRKIFGNDFVDEDEDCPIEEMTDPDALKSRIFHEFIEKRGRGEIVSWGDYLGQRANELAEKSDRLRSLLFG